MRCPHVSGSPVGSPDPVVAACGAGAAGIAKGIEKRPREEVLIGLPFGMPLDADGEAATFDPHPLDLAVGRHRLDDEPGSRAVDALAVERVDQDLAAAPGEALEGAPGGK